MSSQATARKTIAMVAAPVTMILTRKKQKAARTITGAMMMKGAVMRLKRIKRVIFHDILTMHRFETAGTGRKSLPLPLPYLFMISALLRGKQIRYTRRYPSLAVTESRFEQVAPRLLGQTPRATALVMHPVFSHPHWVRSEPRAPTPMDVALEVAPV